MSTCITIGGVDYKSLSLSELMAKISYVTQDTFLFNMSIMENIRLGNPTIYFITTAALHAIWPCGPLTRLLCFRLGR